MHRRTDGLINPLVLRLEAAIAALAWALLATPLILTSDPIFPYQVGKGFAIRLLIEAMAVLYVWLCLVHPPARARRDGLFWSAIAYAVVLVLSTVFGIDPYRSFWGTLERMEGAFGVLHGVLLFIVLGGVLRDRNSWIRFFRVSLIVSVAVAGYALAQVFPWARLVPVEGIVNVQPGSTLGHSTHLATYALFNLFFASFVVIHDRQRAWRWVAVIVALIQIVMLALSAVRGMQVALMAAVAVGGAWMAFDRRFSARWRLGSVVLLIGAAGLLATARSLSGSSIIQHAPYALQRLSTISLETPTARTRLIALGISQKAVLERPWLGWGPESFEEVYRRWYDPAILEYEDAWFDRAHNKLAEVAVDTGLAGLVAYLSILCFAAAGVVRQVRGHAEERERWGGIVLLMLGTAYVVQNLFTFDTALSHALFWSTLAFAAHVGRPLGTPSAPGPVRSSQPWLRRIVGVFSVLVLVSWWWTIVRPFRTAVEGACAVVATDPTAALASFRAAVDPWTFGSQEAVRMTVHALASSRRPSRPEWSLVADACVDAVEHSESNGRADVRTLVQLGRLFQQKGGQHLGDAERVLRRAVELSPRAPLARSELGVTLLRMGRAEEGLAQFRDVVALNDRNTRAHWMYGVALLTQGRREEARQEIDRALEMGYDWDTPEGRAVLIATRAGPGESVRRLKPKN